MIKITTVERPTKSLIEIKFNDGVSASVTKEEVRLLSKQGSEICRWRIGWPPNKYGTALKHHFNK